jgi:hypothetical protein
MARIQIPNLSFRKLANGAIGAYWVPSPALRKAGWKSVTLGTDMKIAREMAEAKNEEVATWRNGGAKPREVKKLVKRHTMSDLIARYETDMMADAAREDRFEKKLSPETKKEYRSAFRAIEIWAEEGTTPITAITDKDIELLKKLLLGARHADGRPKRHRAVQILRMLRTLFNFAVAQKMIFVSPMANVKVPEPSPRTRIIGPEAIAAVRAAAIELKRPDVELGVLLGLWTLQRQSDVIRLSHANWREMTDIAAEDRRVLARADGKVMSLTMRQRKTNKWVPIPPLPELRERIETAFAENAKRKVPLTVLVADPDEPRGTPQWKFQRGFRAAVDAALVKATAEQDEMLVDQLTGIQFRDLRRTGMCLMRELGLTVLFISTLSGHSIDETTKILETYMPADPRTAAAAVAMLATRLGERAAAEKEAG